MKTDTYPDIVINKETKTMTTKQRPLPEAEEMPPLKAYGLSIPRIVSHGSIAAVEAAIHDTPIHTQVIHVMPEVPKL